MPDPLEVSERPGVGPRRRSEQRVLLHQRGDVPERLAHRQDEARVREQLEQVLQPGDVVVGLGEVAPDAAQVQELADVVAIEGLELGVARGGVEHCARPRVVQRREERHPEDLFEGLGALRCNADAVFVAALGRLGLPSLGPIEEPAPEVRREYRRVVLVAMGRGVPWRASASSRIVLPERARPLT